MYGVNEIWNQSINVCKTMLDVAGAMLPGKGAKSKDTVAATNPLISTVECTCVKSKGNGSLVKPGYSCIGPGAGSVVRLAGLSGALAVGLGAYGAHVIMMDENIPDEQKHSYRTANMYHFVGTFGLVAAALGNRPILTGVLMATGTILFCGSCYCHGLTGDNRVKAFAPIGGTTLILAWLSLIL